MAKTKWYVVTDIHESASGYRAVKPEEKFLKGETLGVEAISGITGVIGPVLEGKIVQVEAEGEEEACKVAREAYAPKGSWSGVSAVPHAEKELKFFAV